jgi:hypothetical protein
MAFSGETPLVMIPFWMVAPAAPLAALLADRMLARSNGQQRGTVSLVLNGLACFVRKRHYYNSYSLCKAPLTLCSDLIITYL